MSGLARSQDLWIWPSDSEAIESAHQTAIDLMEGTRACRFLNTNTIKDGSAAIYALLRENEKLRHALDEVQKADDRHIEHRANIIRDCGVGQ